MKCKIEHYDIMALSQEKKGGPYTKKQRLERQNEVFKLHFDYGYSASKISELMKINRNTINDDINHGYAELSKEWKKTDVNSWLMKQVSRFEAHRIKLLDEYEKQETTKEKMLVYRLILEVETKISQIYLNMKTKYEIVHQIILDEMHKMLIRSKSDLRVVRSTDVIETTSEKHDLIESILKGKTKTIQQIKDVINKEKELEHKKIILN